MMTYLPQGVESHFQLNRYDLYYPDDEGVGSQLDQKNGDVFDLKLSVHPYRLFNSRIGRKKTQQVLC